VTKTGEASQRRIVAPIAEYEEMGQQLAPQSNGRLRVQLLNLSRAIRGESPCDVTYSLKLTEPRADLVNVESGAHWRLTVEDIEYFGRRPQVDLCGFKQPMRQTRNHLSKGDYVSPLPKAYTPRISRPG
jgi:hypothetical protein